MSEPLLTLRQFQILGVLAQGYKHFYFPFAKVNYGGQVFKSRRGWGAGCRDEREWRITVPAEEVARDIMVLATRGLLRAWRCEEEPGVRRAVSVPELEQVLALYEDYDCLTDGDHLDRYGYGPVDFDQSPAGFVELDREDYRDFRRRLGWE